MHVVSTERSCLMCRAFFTVYRCSMRGDWLEITTWWKSIFSVHTTNLQLKKGPKHGIDNILQSSSLFLGSAHWSTTFSKFGLCWKFVEKQTAYQKHCRYYYFYFHWLPIFMIVVYTITVNESSLLMITLQTLSCSL